MRERETDGGREREGERERERERGRERKMERERWREREVNEVVCGRERDNAIQVWSKVMKSTSDTHTIFRFLGLPQV